MTPEVQRFAILVALGFLLLGMEVILPGGVVGAIGGLFLLGAMAAGFQAFGSEGGWLASGLMIVIGGIGLMTWIKLLPRTPMGRRLTLNKDGRDFKSTPPQQATQWLGASGVAQSDLRPGGVAKINGERVDVVSDSGYVTGGTPITVVAVEGNRIVVRAQRKD